MSGPTGRVLSSISARFRRKSRIPVKATEEVNTHKLVENAVRVIGRILTPIIVFVQGQRMPNVYHTDNYMGWVLHIAKVAYFFSSTLPNVEWPILRPLPFFFYQKSFIFRFLENCF